MDFKDKLRRDVFSYLRARIFLGFLQFGGTLLVVGFFVLIGALVTAGKGNQPPKYLSVREDNERSQAVREKMEAEHSRMMESFRMTNQNLRRSNQELRQKTKIALDEVEDRYKTAIKERKPRFFSTHPSPQAKQIRDGVAESKEDSEKAGGSVQ